MEIQEVKHYQIGQKYKMQFERSAVKGVDGYKVEANGDDIAQVISDAKTLKLSAEAATLPPFPPSESKEGK